MALTSISVLGQPSVLYFRLNQPPSRYQPSRPCSMILASTCSSEYGLSFSRVAMGDRLLLGALHHTPPVDVDGLPGHERGGRRGEVDGRLRAVGRRPPPPQRRRLRHRLP